MSFLRQKIIAQITMEITLICIFLGVASFGLAKYQILDTRQSFLLGFIIFLLAVIFLLITRIQIPLNKVIREMKALLTGKPYHRIITEKQNEIGILAHFFNEVTRNLEEIYGDIKVHKRVQKELSSAQDIQRMLIPKSAPKMQDMEITAKTRPASEIGGDTFDFYTQKNRNLLYIGDSTGHGIPAGIVMVMVDALLETFIDLKDSLVDVVITLNKYLKPHLKPSMFMTMMLVEWLPAESKIKWVGAGHEHLIHARTKQGKIDVIRAGGLAIGMVADNSQFVKEQELTMEENDFIILYSDGITEAQNMLGEIYGLERLKTFVENQCRVELSSEDLFKKIAIDVSRFMEGKSQLDDMTLIVMKHTEKKSAQLDQTTEWKA
ncbi:MAG: SpoIIE family protein phosphatase [Candidatus Gracilibacteria bacterium]